MAVQRWCLRLIGPWTRLNARFPWSHNEAYGPWVAWQARRLRTPRPRRALDVGCGTGHLLLRLARVVDQVTGWEPDPASASAASALTADDHRITVLQRSILDHQEDTDRAGWDLISMVAVLHHLPLQETLNRLRSMIKPGGRLVIVGLSRETGDDLAWSAVSVLLNPLIGLVLNLWPGRTTVQMTAPATEPRETLDEIRDVAEQVLPGVRIRRGLFFRYTLVWQRPQH